MTLLHMISSHCLRSKSYISRGCFSLRPSLRRGSHIKLGSEYLNTLPLVVSRSGCDLQSVTIVPPPGATVSFSALQHCPTIRDLKIFDTGDINTLCAILTVRHDSPIWLPKLNDIKFFLDAEDPTSVSGFAQLNLETFMAMLKSRWNVAGCAHISHVHIEAWWHIELQYIEALLSRLVEFDDGELSLWLTDFNPIDPSWGDPTYTVPFQAQVSRRLRWS
ncbi:hypothetical protein C8J57DRAFT_214866 [Mycena rebaudengoi]|nr:hypothetical protein C8J57DRAFT_214866 [Mycena rebaudengoi]